MDWRLGGEAEAGAEGEACEGGLGGGYWGEGADVESEGGIGDG